MGRSFAQLLGSDDSFPRNINDVLSILIVRPSLQKQPNNLLFGILQFLMKDTFPLTY